MNQEEYDYKTILATIADGYYEVDLAGNFTFFNDSHAELHGRTRSELEGVNYRDYVAPEDLDKVFEAYNQVYITGEPIKRIEFALHTKDGTKHIVECSISLIKTPEGKPIGFRGMTRDVTERIMNQEALRKSEEKHRTILELVEEAFYENDLEGNFTLVTDSLARNLGYSKEELMGMNYRQYMDSENAKKVLKAYHEVYVTGETKTLFHYVVTKKDGTPIDNEISISLIRDEKGRPTGFRGVGRDITKRKKAEEELKRAKEQAEAASMAKTHFLANMSHEIRTPMNAILGFTELMQDTPLDDIQSDYLRIIKKNGNALVEMLNTILDLSKMESGNLDFQEIEFNPVRIIDEVTDIIRAEIGSKPIELICRIGNSVPVSIMGDPLRFRQVISHILDNAVKFTDMGDIELSLAVDSEENGRLKLHGSIRDTGIGVPVESRQSIFNVFYQVDNSHSRKYGGVGLGLTLCKKIVTHLGGDIWVESPDTPAIKTEHSDAHEQPPGPGSIFHFTGWYRKVESTQPVILEDKHPHIVNDNPRIEQDKTPGVTILLAEDNPTNQKLAQIMLSKGGYHVEVVNNGLEAFNAYVASPHDFDLILMDVQMPEVDGITATRMIREKGFSAVPIIAMTAHALTGDKEVCLSAGMNGYLTKPIKKESVFQLIEKWVLHKQGSDTQE